MTLSSFSPQAPHETGRQYAYRILYRSIMTLELEPGAQLQDTELSKLLGVSRTPVREAIMSLQDARLVEVYPQRSSCVSRINLDYVEEGVFLRYNIEKAIVNEAMFTSDGAALTRIRENLAQQKLYIDTHSDQDFTELDNAFHQLIYLAARKPWRGSPCWPSTTTIAPSLTPSSPGIAPVSTTCSIVTLPRGTVPPSPSCFGSIRTISPTEKALPAYRKNARIPGRFFRLKRPLVLACINKKDGIRPFRWRSTYVGRLFRQPKPRPSPFGPIPGSSVSQPVFPLP